MLKDFAKLETFLVVVKEKSFSKASAKLGISQPAVTQQIKFIEDYLDAQIVERKKNGIKLTKEGEDFYRVVHKLAKAVETAEKDILKIINKEFTFKMGATFTIGHYIIPKHVEDIKDIIKNNVFISIDKTKRVIDMLIDKTIDVALVDTPIHQDGIATREWMDDELIIFSNQQIPNILEKDDLYRFNWICRDEGSPTRQIITEAFEEIDVDCTSFNIKGIVDNSTLAKETISHCIFKNRPTVSIISRSAILKELKEGTLFEGRLKDIELSRKLYIAYNRDRKKDAFIDKVAKYLLDIYVN
jgi:DNA-binding transcriptional LysR family regulator